MNGIINIIKPPGMSSHDVVNFVRKTLKIKKAGHTGTLDPGAAGVLVVCLGTATRLAQFMINDDKEYRAEITFGLKTSTGDSFGDVTCESDASPLDQESVCSVLASFTGEIRQTPPMTSAIKLKGKKLYELARAGQVVERPERTVNIYALEFIRGNGWGGPRPSALLHLSCSKGTYVRALCEDIGDRLGYGAHMSFLVRTRSGDYHIDRSVTIEEVIVAATQDNLSSIIISMDEALAGLPSVMVKSGAVTSVLSGAKLYLPGVLLLPDNLAVGNMVRLVGPDGLIALAETAADPENNGRLYFKSVCLLAKQADKC